MGTGGGTCWYALRVSARVAQVCVPMYTNSKQLYILQALYTFHTSMLFQLGIHAGGEKKLFF